MNVVGIPTYGCNYFSNTNSFINYYNGTATTYLIIEGKAIRTRTSTYTGLPTGYVCVNANDVTYKPEFVVYGQFIAIVLCALIGGLLWKTIGRLIGR